MEDCIMPLAKIIDDDGNPIIFDTDDDSISKDQKTMLVINLLYGFDGTNWERVATDGSGNVKIVLG